MKHPQNKKSKVQMIACGLLLALLFYLPVFASAENILDTIPVKEVTIFKDGHSFVLHEGKIPTDNNGNVTFNELPSPVLGTFWAYSADAKVKLNSVLVGKKLVSKADMDLTIPKLIKANAGKKVLIKQNNLATTYEAIILQRPLPKDDDENNSQPNNSNVNSNIVLLKTLEGIKAVPINFINEITFIDEPNTEIDSKDYINTMTFKLNSKNNSPKTADVGMAYVQKGLRWIPNYRVEIDGKGNAVIKLQATIINELTDLENVNANLVIGVPSFAFKDSIDPIALDQTVAQLSQNFQSNSQTAYAFYNGIRSQVMREADYEMPAQPGSGPELSGSEKNEDLFVFTFENLTLKKGERIVVPITEYKIEYTDVYKLSLAVAPPREFRNNFNSSQNLQIEKLMNQPVTKHCLRLQNNSDYPLTTAPALILNNDRIVAQGLMTYTPVGGLCDLEMSTAVDVFVKCYEEQTKHINNAAQVNGYNYSRIDMNGTVPITNHKKKAIKIEVKRFVLGNINEANLDAEIKQLGHGGYGSWLSDNSLPVWWNWRSWPGWWYHVNTLGQIKWDIELKPGQKVTLKYQWHYLWRY